MSITLYHNPRCSKSRATLQLLRDRGHEPEIVLYLDNPPDTATLKTLLGLLRIGPRELMRKGEAEYSEIRDDLDDNALIAALHRHPRLIQRPIVVANGQARIGRPPESVLDIL